MRQHSHQGHSTRSGTATGSSVSLHGVDPQGCPSHQAPILSSLPVSRWAVHHLAFRWARRWTGRLQGQNRACGRMWLGAMFCLAHTDFLQKYLNHGHVKIRTPTAYKVVRAKLIRGCATLDRKVCTHHRPRPPSVHCGISWPEQHLEVVGSQGSNAPLHAQAPNHLVK